jgi:hypothetical protein
MNNHASEIVDVWSLCQSLFNNVEGDRKIDMTGVSLHTLWLR